MPSKRIFRMGRGGLYIDSNRHCLNATPTARDTCTRTRRDTNGLSVRATVYVCQKLTHMLVGCQRRSQDSSLAWLIQVCAHMSVSPSSRLSILEVVKIFIRSATIDFLVRVQNCW